MIKSGIYTLEAVQEYEKKLKIPSQEERIVLLLEDPLRVDQVPLKEAEEALKALESTADNISCVIRRSEDPVEKSSPYYSLMYLSLPERLERKMKYISLDMHRNNIGTYLQENETEKAEKLIDDLIDFINMIHERGLEIKQRLKEREDLFKEFKDNEHWEKLLLYMDYVKSSISIRQCHYLFHEGIIYTGDLVQKSEAELLQIRGFGPRSLNKIKEFLTGMGLSLGMSIPNWKLIKLYYMEKKKEEK